MLGAAKPPTARVPVVLDQFAAMSFLGVLAGALSADAVQKGRSLFADLVGEQVGSELFTLVDDGTNIEGPGAAPFDDEGCPSGRTELFTKGVLNGFLHNTYTAHRRARRSRPATASAAVPSARPASGTSNFYLDAGETPRRRAAPPSRGRRLDPRRERRALRRQPDQRGVQRRRDGPADRRRRARGAAARDDDRLDAAGDARRPSRASGTTFASSPRWGRRRC